MNGAHPEGDGRSPHQGLMGPGRTRRATSAMAALLLLVLIGASGSVASGRGAVHAHRLATELICNLDRNCSVQMLWPRAWHGSPPGARWPGRGQERPVAAAIPWLLPPARAPTL